MKKIIEILTDFWVRIGSCDNHQKWSAVTNFATTVTIFFSKNYSSKLSLTLLGKGRYRLSVSALHRSEFLELAGCCRSLRYGSASKVWHLPLVFGNWASLWSECHWGTVVNLKADLTASLHQMTPYKIGKNWTKLSIEGDYNPKIARNLVG